MKITVVETSIQKSAFFIVLYGLPIGLSSANYTALRTMTKIIK